MIPTVEGVDVVLPPLQSCSGILDCWSKAQLFEGGLRSLEQTAPVAALALVVAFATYYGLYEWSKSHVVPTVTLLLMGGAIFPLLPSAAARLAWIVILLAGGTALFAIYWAVIR